MIKILTIILILISFTSISSGEIVKDINGNFFLIKKDGSYEELPPPKPGNRYIVKKKSVKINKPKKKIFKRVEKKSRIRTNQGFR